MKNPKINLLLIVLVGLTMFSCKNETKEEARTLEVEEMEEVTPGEEGPAVTAEEDEVLFENAGLETVFNSYIDLKDALVASDASQASDAASRLELTLTNIEASPELNQAVDDITNTTDLEEQRKAFSNISTEMENLIEGSINSGIVYKQYCPMAFDGEGASWLSTSQIILNPYFGDEMLKCGSVEKTFE